MKVDTIFERLVLREAEARCPQASVGRPRVFNDQEAFELMFRVLRSGMQWRELQCGVAYTTILRRMHTWHSKGVFRAAYIALLRTYKKLLPTEYYCVDSTYVKNLFRTNALVAIIQIVVAKR